MLRINDEYTFANTGCNMIGLTFDGNDIINNNNVNASSP